MTMGDLAVLAGVSKITVSRALRDSPLVREAVRERVKALSLAHGYRLNAAARSLRTRRAHSITAAIEMDPSADRPFSEPVALSLIGGLLQAVATRGYRLVLTTRSEALSSNILDTEGVILLGLGPNDEAIQQMRRFNLPLVVWGSSRPAFDNVVFLGSDNVTGGRLVGEHLAGLGRRHILFLGDTSHSEVADRLEGLSAAVAGGGIEITQTPCAFAREAAQVAVEAALEGGLTFDAVVGCSDPMALGAIDRLRARGIDVPGAIAVTGYDDATRDPLLTSVRQDWDMAGAMLAQMMFESLAGGGVTSAKLPVELIVRASTRPG
jgi:DNA-binding LacI/PurR family transcriptional regulator